MFQKPAGAKLQNVISKPLDEMKKIIYIIILISFSRKIHGQTNIIPNGSFETYTTCPGSINSGSPDEVSRATGWYTIRKTPDYFNSCASGTIINTPNNFFGYQNPVSGNAYMGLWAYQYMANPPNYRECIAAKLTTTMVISQKYFVKINISNAEDYLSNGGVDKVGLRFSTVKHTTSSLPPINNFAHAYSTTIMKDTINWKTIFLSFIADSNYQYIEIGNFFDDANTNFQANKTGGDWAYYYIDDICASTDSLYTLNWNSTTTSIVETSPNNSTHVWPNPCSNFVYIKLQEQSELVDIKISNALGEILFLNSNSTLTTVNLSDFPDGLYFIQITSNGKTFNAKIIVRH